MTQEIRTIISTLSNISTDKAPASQEELKIETATAVNKVIPASSKPVTAEVPIDTSNQQQLKIKIANRQVEIPLPPAQQAIIKELSPTTALVQQFERDTLVSVISKEQMQALTRTMQQSPIKIPLSQVAAALPSPISMQANVIVKEGELSLVDANNQPIRLPADVRQALLNAVIKGVQAQQISLPPQMNILAQQLTDTLESDGNMPEQSVELAKQAESKDTGRNISLAKLLVQQVISSDKVTNVQQKADVSSQSTSDKQAILTAKADPSIGTSEVSSNKSATQTDVAKAVMAAKVLAFAADFTLTNQLDKATLAVKDHQARTVSLDMPIDKLPKPTKTEIVERIVSSALAKQSLSVDLNKMTVQFSSGKTFPLAELIQANATSSSIQGSNKVLNDAGVSTIGEISNEPTIANPKQHQAKQQEAKIATVTSALNVLKTVLPAFTANAQVKDNQVTLKPALSDLASQIKALANIHVQVDYPRAEKHATQDKVVIAQPQIQHIKILTPSETQQIAKQIFAATSKPDASQMQTVSLINTLPLIDAESMKLLPESRQQLLKIAVNQISMDMNTALKTVQQQISATPEPSAKAVLEALAPMMPELEQTSIMDSIKTSAGFQYQGLAPLEPNTRPLSFMTATDTALKLILGLKSQATALGGLPPTLIGELKVALARLAPDKQKTVSTQLTSTKLNRSLAGMPNDLIKALSSLRGQSLLSQFQSQDSQQPPGALHMFLPFTFQGDLQKAELYIKPPEQQGEEEDENEGKRGWQFRMKLQAGKLGDILVNAKYYQDEVSFDLYTDRQSTADTVSRFLPNLSSALGKHDIKVKTSEVTVAEIPESIIDLPPSLLRIKI